MTATLPIRVRGRVVGTVDRTTNTYETTRQVHRHYSFKMRGYGIQTDVLDQLDDLGVEYVRLTVVDGRKAHTYQTRLQEWSENARIVVLRAQDGRQAFLPNAMLGRPVRSIGGACERRWYFCRERAEQPHLCLVTAYHVGAHLCAFCDEELEDVGRIEVVARH